MTHRCLIHWGIASLCALNAVVVVADGIPFIESTRDGEIASGVGRVVHVADDRYRVLVRTDDGRDVVITARADENVVGESHLGLVAAIQAKVHRTKDGNGEVTLEILYVTKLLPAGFKLSEKAIRQAKTTALRESRKKRDLSQRRPQGIADLGSDAAIRRVIKQSMLELGDKDRRIQEQATAKLRYLGELAFDDLMAGLKSEDTTVRFWAAVLLETRVTKAVGPLSELVRTERVDFVRSAAVQALGNTHHPDAVPVLIEALQDEDFSVVSAAIHALENMKDQRAIAPLTNFNSAADQVSQLSQRAERTRAYIARPDRLNYWPPQYMEIRQLTIDAHTLAGERFGKVEHDRLLEHIDISASPVPSACIRALADLHVESAVPSIIALKQRPAFSSEALAKIATPQAVDYLLSCLQSRNPVLRDSALNGLTYQGGRWTVPVLIELLDDGSLRTSRLDQRQRSDRFFNKRWPDGHRVHTALWMRLSAAGLPGEGLNLATGKTYHVDDEISRLKLWWAAHGSDFLQGKNVPNPKITHVFWSS